VTVCDVLAIYFPLANTTLSINLGGVMASGSDSQVIQHSFNSFVKATSDEELTNASHRFKEYLNYAIAHTRMVSNERTRRDRAAPSPWMPREQAVL
jgi:hypothetical protein